MTTSRIPFATLAIALGAPETAGGAQELIVQGVFANRTYPLVAGTLGTVAGGSSWPPASLCCFKPGKR